ncbi:MAG: LegC family aminotransferase [Rhodospirillaceae bacterium]
MNDVYAEVIGGGFDVAAVMAALRAVLPSARPLALHEPDFSGREQDYLRECLDSGWVSSAGPRIEEFERRLAARCGVARAVAVVNGTAGLHTALMLAGVRAGDEVLVPTLTFIATANAVAHAGAVPHFVDSERATFGIDPHRLGAYLDEIAVLGPDGPVNHLTGRRIAALVPVHVFGHPAAMDALNQVAARWRLAVVEDATEALGSLYRGRPAGSLSRLAVLSFNGNKIITTGGGGAILTDDPALADAARHLTTTAKMAHQWRFEHDRVGWNYRMPNLNAALGCAQLERLDFFLDAKRRLAARYRDRLAGLPGLKVVAEPAGCVSNYWLNAVLVPDAAARDALLAACHAEGLQARPAWGLMHEQVMYAACPRAALPVAEALAARLVCLPSGVGCLEVAKSAGTG